MRIKNAWHKIKRWRMKLRLQPIYVYCLHHVSVTYDAESMNRSDWMQIDEFKHNVLALQQEGVKFISLSEAYNKITNDKIRHHKYAVITFDDGYTSLKEILPWLEEQQIPATLFINGKYLDGKSYRENPQEQYLTEGELYALTSQFIEIGSHGWEHTDASKMSKEEFEQNIVQNINILCAHPRYIPFHAYTWGKHTKVTDVYLLSQGMTPLYMDGQKNYNDANIIHRELLQ